MTLVWDTQRAFTIVTETHLENTKARDYVAGNSMIASMVEERNASILHSRHFFRSSHQNAGTVPGQCVGVCQELTADHGRPSRRQSGH